MTKKIRKWAKDKIILARLGLIAIIVLIYWFWPGPPNPVPANIKRQVGFTILYPSGYTIAPSAWNYSNGQQTLNFTAKTNNYSVVFTEQQTPLAYQNDVAAYDRFIGGLKPSANFNTKLGTVSLTTFVFAGDFQPYGTTGILNAKGTLLLAHPNSDLTDNEWQSLFGSLKVSK